MSGRSLYFSHIPKTAGTTLYRFLENHFHASEVFEGAFPEDAGLWPQRATTARLVRGHFFSSKQFFDSGAEVDFLTVLAHPAHRYISQVKHFVRVEVQNRTDDLAPNLQTFWLARDLAYPIMGPMLARMSEEQLYAMALDRMRSAYWVGLRERYIASMLLLCLLRQWRPIGLDASENVAPPQPLDFAPGTRDWFEEANRCDIKLWSAAQGRLDRDVAVALERFGPADGDSEWLAERWARLGELGYCGSTRSWFHGDGEVGMLYRAAQLAYLRRREREGAGKPVLEVAASAPFEGEGWHRREVAPGVVPYRWSGPESVSDLHLPCKLDGNVLVTVHLVGWNDEIAPQELIVSIDGGRMNSRVEHHRELPGCLLRCRGRAVVTGLPFSVLRFECPRTKPLIEFAGAPDTRRVGFAFRSILVSD